jgi:hypothetical protein
MTIWYGIVCARESQMHNIRRDSIPDSEDTVSILIVVDSNKKPYKT